MSELKNKNIWIHITFFSILGCGLGDRQFSENSDFRGMTGVLFLSYVTFTLTLTVLDYQATFSVQMRVVLLPQVIPRYSENHLNFQRG